MQVGEVSTRMGEKRQQVHLQYKKLPVTIRSLPNIKLDIGTPAFTLLLYECSDRPRYFRKKKKEAKTRPAHTSHVNQPREYAKRLTQQAAWTWRICQRRCSWSKAMSAQSYKSSCVVRPPPGQSLLTQSILRRPEQWNPGACGAPWFFFSPTGSKFYSTNTVTCSLSRNLFLNSASSVFKLDRGWWGRWGEVRGINR